MHMSHVAELTERLGEHHTATILSPMMLQLKLNADVMKTALDGLDARELASRPSPQTNSMLWIFGHIVATRSQMLALLGDPFDTGFGKRFNRGAVADGLEDLSREDIEQRHQTIRERLDAKLNALTNEELGRAASGPQLPGAKTLADQLAFFAFHEAYHVGQLGYVRKMLGHTPVAG
jgi:uncharacterized damage-inducible protein DinB